MSDVISMRVNSTADYESSTYSPVEGARVPRDFTLLLLGNFVVSWLLARLPCDFPRNNGAIGGRQEHMTPTPHSMMVQRPGFQTVPEYINMLTSVTRLWERNSLNAHLIHRLSIIVEG